MSAVKVSAQPSCDFYSAYRFAKGRGWPPRETEAVRYDPGPCGEGAAVQRIVITPKNEQDSFLLCGKHSGWLVRDGVQVQDPPS